MKLELILAVSVVAATSLFPMAANADSYSSVTTSTDEMPVNEVTTRTSTVETAPSTTVIREQPVVVPPVENNTLVVKKRSHHLIKVGPVKVF